MTNAEKPPRAFQSRRPAVEAAGRKDDEHSRVDHHKGPESIAVVVHRGRSLLPGLWRPGADSLVMRLCPLFCAGAPCLAPGADWAGALTCSATATGDRRADHERREREGCRHQRERRRRNPPATVRRGASAGSGSLAPSRSHRTAACRSRQTCRPQRAAPRGGARAVPHPGCSAKQAGKGDAHSLQQAARRRSWRNAGWRSPPSCPPPSPLIIAFHPRTFLVAWSRYDDRRCKPGGDIRAKPPDRCGVPGTARHASVAEGSRPFVRRANDRAGGRLHVRVPLRDASCSGGFTQSAAVLHGSFNASADAPYIRQRA